MNRFVQIMRESIVPWIGLVFALLVLGWLVYRVREWFRGDEDPEVLNQELLTQVSELHRKGDLSEPEYRSIKGRLIERMKQDDS